jgi:hypothetical protein
MLGPSVLLPYVGTIGHTSLLLLVLRLLLLLLLLLSV